MILNCLIIDDEPIARKLLQEYIEETDFLKLAGTAVNPLKAVSMMDEMEIDLIFLDINMPKMSGLEFLRSTKNLPMVIMTTAYAQYALDGFEMDVVDYLVKPFGLDRFLKATRKALELKQLRQKQAVPETHQAGYFYVKCNGKIEKVVYSDLLYVEAMANYIVLHTTHNKLVVYLTIKGIMEKLPAGEFLQVHKSYVVNTNRINTIEGNILHLGSAKITIGLSFSDAVLAHLLKDKIIKR